MDGMLSLWHDFAEQRDVGQTQKPETWAASVFYAFDLMKMGDHTQEHIANIFDVSALTISNKYREMTEVLDLTVADERYVPDAQIQNLRRELGADFLPTDLPLTDATDSLWHLPFGLRDGDELQDAQERVYDGLDLFSSGELDAAEEQFRTALDADPWLADAYNGLAYVALERGQIETAEEHAQKAYEIARDTLGTESPKAYSWWLELSTRPYMRAREERAQIWEVQGKYQKAAHEFEALLTLNPNDNQGVRHRIGPLYQMDGDLEAALDFYDWYQEQYPNDMSDPHHTYSWGLAHFHDGNFQKAIRIWYRAFFDNLYVVPSLLEHESVPDDVWLRSNMEDREYGELYWMAYGAMWDVDAMAALVALWENSAVRKRRNEWIELGRELNELAPAARNDEPDARSRWEECIITQDDIVERHLSDTVVEQVMKRLGDLKNQFSKIQDEIEQHMQNGAQT